MREKTYHLYLNAGAGFKIYDPQGNQVKMTFTYPTPTTIDVFYRRGTSSIRICA